MPRQTPTRPVERERMTDTACRPSRRRRSWEHTIRPPRTASPPPAVPLVRTSGPPRRVPVRKTDRGRFPDRPGKETTPLRPPSASTELPDTACQSDSRCCARRPGCSGGKDIPCPNSHLGSRKRTVRLRAGRRCRPADSRSPSDAPSTIHHRPWRRSPGSPWASSQARSLRPRDTPHHRSSCNRAAIRAGSN